MMQTTNNCNICLIGIFPPPFHGMSKLNDYVKLKISQYGNPLILNYSPNTLHRSIFFKGFKFYFFLGALFKLIRAIILVRYSVTYIGLSGGYGQIYDLIFIFILRIFGSKFYLHHHSYQYLDKKSFLAGLIFFISGKESVHIVACPKMGHDLKNNYSNIDTIKIISGIVCTDDHPTRPSVKKKLKKIGFLGNISIEKGIFEFLKIAELSLKLNLPLHFKVAGPFQDGIIEKKVLLKLSRLQNVEFIGPVYGEDKIHFFDSIDLFLFPTFNEAEGLVMHEAMSRSVPVIAYARGCIPEILVNDAGYLVSTAEEFSSAAMPIIQTLLKYPQLLERISENSFMKFDSNLKLHANNMDLLCSEIVDASL